MKGFRSKGASATGLEREALTRRERSEGFAKKGEYGLRQMNGVLPRTKVNEELLQSSYLIGVAHVVGDVCGRRPQKGLSARPLGTEDLSRLSTEPAEPKQPSTPRCRAESSKID